VEGVLADRAARSVQILDVQPVSGGCIHRTVRLSTNLSEDFFLKWATGTDTDVFAAEADGLTALSESTRLTVPRVIGYSDVGEGSAWLLLEYVPRGSPGPDYAERLGGALAEFHEARPDPYGWHRSNYIGSLRQTNTPMDDWPRFWWSERLEPQLALARANGQLPGLEAEWDTLESRLPTLLEGAAADGCAILHGDLWSGNVYPGPDGGPVLVDPAVYRGHREVDLAMTELFGGFPGSFYDAYRERRPLVEGYEAVRRNVYQLYPLLVHVNLFGGGYVEGAAASLRRALRIS